MGNKNRTRTPPPPGAQTTFQNAQPRRTQPQWAEPYKAIPRPPRVSPMPPQAKAPQPAPPSGPFGPTMHVLRAFTDAARMAHGQSPRPMMDAPMPAQALQQRQQRAPQWARPYQHIDR